MRAPWNVVIVLVAVLIQVESLLAGDTRSTETYKRVKASIDAVPSIDTHDHLWPFDRLPAFSPTKAGKQVNLAGLWRNSYLPGYNAMSPWQESDDFDSWWARGKNDFKNVRALSFYRYQLPAFQDLYGVALLAALPSESQCLIGASAPAHRAAG